MGYEYVKATPITVREAGKDEKWLQDVIAKDPAILGLGDVLMIERERAQPTGGRLDLVLADQEEELRYEVEIMLGTVDESHIIRTIEYWDVERRRYPAYEHRAVIIAEEITNRFFNVIGLLNRSIPIIAIQLNAFLMDEKLCLNFVTVLDVLEEAEEELGEQVDRKYWEARASKESLELMDNVIILIPFEKNEVRVKYNRGHVAVGTTGNNFLWVRPRKANNVHLELKVGQEVRERFLPMFEAAGLDCSAHRSDVIKMTLSSNQLSDNKPLIQEILGTANEKSRK